MAENTKRPDLSGFEDKTSALVKPQEGDWFIGEFVASGSYKDDRGKTVKTYEFQIEQHADSLRIEAPRVKLLGTTQLDQAFETIDEGTTVYVERQPDGKTKKGEKMHQFLVKAKK